MDYSWDPTFFTCTLFGTSVHRDLGVGLRLRRRVIRQAGEAGGLCAHGLVNRSEYLVALAINSANRYSDVVLHMRKGFLANCARRFIHGPIMSPVGVKN